MATYTVDGVRYRLPDGMSDADALDLIHQMQGGGDTSSNSGVATTRPTNTDPTTDPDQLQHNKDWMDSSRLLYRYNNGEDFKGTDSELAEWGLDQMGWFNYNMPTMAVDATRIAQAPDEVKKSFVNLMDTYDNLDMSWEGSWRFIKGAALDPTTYAGLGTLGIGTLASGGAKIASKEALKELLISGVRTGIEGSIQSGVADAIQQSVRMNAGTQQGFDTTQLLESGGGGFAVGGALGAAAPIAGKALGAGKEALGSLFRGAEEDAGKAVKPGPETPQPTETPNAEPAQPAAPADASEAQPAAPADTPAAAPEAVPGDPAKTPETVAEAAKAADAAPTNLDPDPSKAPAVEAQPEGGTAVEPPKPLGDGGEQLELFPEMEKVQTKPESEPINVGKRLQDNPVYEAVRRVANDDGGRTFPTSKSDIADAVKDPLKALNDIKPEDIKANIEELRRAYTTGQERQLVDQTVQAATEKLLQRNAMLTHLLEDKTLPPEVRTAIQAERDASYKTEQVLRLADLDQSSMAGSNLGSRAGLVNTGEARDLSVESVLKEKGIDPNLATDKERGEAMNDYYSRMMALRDAAARNKEIVNLENKAQTALDNGDFAEANRRMAEAEVRKTAAQTPSNGVVSSAMKYLNEYLISNVFSPRSIMLNTVPHVIQSVFRPTYEAALKGFDGKAVAQMMAQYSIIGQNMNIALKAAALSFKYEKGLLSGDMRYLEQNTMLKKAYGGGILRIFPRLNSAIDEFFGQLSYRAYVASEAAGRAYDMGQAAGLEGDALKSYIEKGYTAAVGNAFAPTPRTSVVTFLRQEAVSRGYSGAKLDNWVVEQLNQNGHLLREATNQLGKNFADDLAFKRDFSGDEGNGWYTGAISSAAKHYEEFVNKNPWMRLIGQMFFRTPVRVFEEGFRLTAGLNLVTPGFYRDLSGKGFGGIGGYAQLRAQGEMMLSYAIAQAAIYEYSQGNLHGAGGNSFKDYRVVQQQGNDPNFDPYSMKIGGVTWSFRNFDPFSTPLKIMANALDGYAMLQTRRAQGENVSKQESDALAYLQVASLAIAQSVKDANLMEGLSELTQIGTDLSSPDDQSQAIMKYINKKATTFVPFGGAVNRFAQVNSPTLTDPATLDQYLLAKVNPGSASVPKRYDALGYPVVSPNPLTGIYGFPDITTDAQKDMTYRSEAQKEALRGLAQVGTLTNTNFTAPYDGAKFASSPNPFLQSLAGMDLRTMKTSDGRESWYDRAQRYVSQSGLDRQLAILFRGSAPTGTPSAKGPKVEIAKELINVARTQAMLRLINEENANSLDKFKQTIINKAQGVSGQHDVPSPF